jgi:hypothetical protein
LLLALGEDEWSTSCPCQFYYQWRCTPSPLHLELNGHACENKKISFVFETELCSWGL